jgi:hypothetical protein
VFDLDYYHLNGFQRDKAVRGLGSGDSFLLLDVLPPPILFSHLFVEREWKTLFVDFDFC